MMASNTYGVEPIQQAKRWDRVAKKQVSIDMPYVVSVYNQAMGGTDRQDQNINKYRVNIRSKKWWWPLFSWGIDVTIQNAWILFRLVNPTWSLVKFRRYIARALLETNGSPSLVGRIQSRPSECIRRSSRPHYAGDEPQKIARRCKLCGLKTIVVCTTCNVHLHVKCFLVYHTM